MKDLLTQKVDRLYFQMSCGHDHHYQEITLSWQDIYRNIEELYLDVARGKIRPEELNEDFLKSYINRLQQPFKPLIKTNFDSPDYSEPNYEFIRQARSNLFHFAGAKTYRELKSLNSIFMKGGQVVPFAEFQRNVDLYRKKVLQVQETYRKSWLQSEYNHAVRTAQSAERWQRAEEIRDVYPNLEYLATIDGRVRDEHRALHKTVRPIDDPFWDTYTPPNGWNCRCRVESTRKTPTEGAPEIKTPKMFQNNPAKTGVVFDQKHPYFEKHNELREQIRDRSSEFALSVYRERQRQVYNSYRNREGYSQESFQNDSGGFLVRENNAGKLTAIEEEMIREIVSEGDGVVLRARSNDPFTTSADVQIRGVSFELKNSSGTIPSIRDRIMRGTEQAKYVVIRVEERRNLEAGISEAIRKLDNPDALSGVLVLSKGKRLMIDRTHLYRNGGVKEMLKKWEE